jgi:uroporphyrinogen-III synthase
VPELPLKGARIALTGTRKAQETADFVRRLGGIPIVAPALDTTPLGGDAGAESDPMFTLNDFLTADPALVIFLTGVGARALVRLAEDVGRGDDLRSALNRAKVVARGPKALGALKGAGIRVDWMPGEATVAAILDGLDQFEIAGRIVAIQWSGFIDHMLRAELNRRAAGVVELDLYRHTAPTNEAPVLALLDSIRDGEVDFLTFTSAIGVREFFALAERHGRDDGVLAALRSGATVPVAVGNVTGAALLDAGVVDPLVPTMHTTGAMLRAIEERITTHLVVKSPKTVDSRFPIK